MKNLVATKLAPLPFLPYLKPSMKTENWISDDDRIVHGGINRWAFFGPFQEQR